MSQSNLGLIDIEKVFAGKNPRLAKRMPKFIFRWIKRILHQEDINQFLIKHQEKKGIDFAKAIIDKFQLTIKLKGQENLPKDGRYIFVANHPMGGLESVGFMRIINDVFPEQIRFPVNDVLLNLKNLDSIFVPINKYGSQNRESSKQILDLYDSDNQILFYPSGMVSRKTKGIIIDPEWKKTFLTKAIRSHRDIVPIYIEGKNSKRFYRVGVWRNFFGIKANLEMFLLPDELYRANKKTITYFVGKPISYKVFDKTYNYNDWVKKVKSHVYSLSENPNKTFKIN